MAGSGSSPRGRGTPQQQRQPHPPGRIIPARAGNATTPTASRTSPPDHPRAGGERWRRAGEAQRQHGSSPRGRGTRKGARQMRLLRRIIPARAGNALHRTDNLSRPTDHPRAGGERRQDFPAIFDRGGSSPRGRGTLYTAVTRAQVARIIPARAGNAPGAVHWRAAVTDHPRAGGERCSGANRMRSAAGSSPRGRGTRPRRA